METASLDHLLSKIRDAICSVSTDAQKDLLDSIIGAKRIFIYGAGRSGLVGQLFAVRLVQIGFDVHFVGDMTAPIISTDDLTILISNSGETMSAVQTANIARRIGSKIICITSDSHSKLAQVSDSIIKIEHDTEGDKQYAPLGTVFEDSVSIFFDSIIPCIMRKKNVSEEDMRRRHAIWV